jgi:hypothetical protein
MTAVEWLYNNLLLNPISNEDIEYNEAVFENAKVLDAQQKRSYNEEEVILLLQKYRFDLSSNKTSNLGDTTKQWFEQFKNK